jgi:hypothetical protein
VWWCRRAKEKLRDALNLRARVTGSTPRERQVRDAVYRFYSWCADHDDIGELVTLANTISRWENEIVAAVLTGGHQCPLRRPQPRRQAPGPQRLRPAQPGQPAPPRPHRLHPHRPPSNLTHRHQTKITRMIEREHDPG